MSRKKAETGRAAGALLLLAACLLTAASAARAQTGGELTEEFHQTYPLAANGRVQLSNINGGVRVGAWDRNEVRVDAVKRAYTAERLREADIKVEASPQSVRVETEYPYRSMNWTNDAEGRRNNPATVEYTLTVPRGARIDEVNLVNGSLDIEGVSGPVDASSVNGRVTARGLTGTVKLSVVNGRLEAAFDRLDEAHPVALSSVNGPLVVTIPSDASAVLRASTVHGHINNDFNLPVRRGEYVGRDLEGRLGGGGARLKLSNVNGSITIRRAADGRPLSPATNLLSEVRKGDDSDDGDDDHDRDDSDADDVAREAGRAVREAQKEVERANRDIKREAAREARQQREEVRREAAREAREAQRAEQAQERDARRDEVREAARATAEAVRAETREAVRAARDAARAVHAEEATGRRIERESNTFPAGGVPRVRVETFDGPVTVHTWDKPEVMYTAIKRAHDDQELKGIRVRTQARNDRSTTRSNGAGAALNASSEITIAAEFDRNFSHSVVSRAGRIVSFSSGASVELDVYVPRNSTLSVSSGDGRLRVEGARGDITLHTGDGSIDVTGGGGNLRAETGDGRIRVADFDGVADARTGDGRIMLEGRFTQLAAHTGDGSISLAIPADSNIIIETDAESVSNSGLGVEEGAATDGTPRRVRRWRVGNGGNTFTLRTGGGQVILRPR